METPQVADTMIDDKEESVTKQNSNLMDGFDSFLVWGEDKEI